MEDFRDERRGGPAEDVMNQAEERLREGVELLNQWGAQARDLIQRQPAAVLIGVAALGFMTGLLLRRVTAGEER